jgi:pimeloyl-ACP methyl ester carboxylesterase
MLPIEQTVSLADGEVFYRAQGTGIPLLLLHGLTGTGADFDHLFALEQLAQTHRVIRPDARGHGRTTTQVTDFTFRRCALDLLALLDHLQLDCICAVGISLGAKTLLHLAREAPARVRSMVLVSAAPRFPDATRASFRASAAMQHSDAEWTAMRNQHSQGDAQIRALYELPARFADDPTDVCFSSDELQKVATPALIVTGDRDPLYPVELALELYRGMPSASLWVVPNGGHSPVFGERREDFERAALSHLGEVAP